MSFIKPFPLSSKKDLNLKKKIQSYHEIIVLFSAQYIKTNLKKIKLKPLVYLVRSENCRASED